MERGNVFMGNLYRTALRGNRVVSRSREQRISRTEMTRGRISNGAAPRNVSLPPVYCSRLEKPRLRSVPSEKEEIPHARDTRVSTLYRSKVSISIRAALHYVVQPVAFRHLRALPRSAPRREYTKGQPGRAGGREG